MDDYGSWYFIDISVDKVSAGGLAGHRDSAHRKST